MFVYESHLGGLYTASYAYSMDELYCDQCGDYDTLLGEFGGVAEFLAEYADNVYTEPGTGGLDIGYICDVFNEHPDMEACLKIVRDNVSDRE